MSGCIRTILLTMAVSSLPFSAHAKFLSPDPVGVMEGGVEHFNRYSYAQNDPVNRKDPDGRDDFFIGGQGETLPMIGANAVKPFAQSFGDARPGRNVQFFDMRPSLIRPNALPNAMRAAAEAGRPVNIACHSRGCGTAMTAIEKAGVTVNNLVTVDPVNSSGETTHFDGQRPDGIENFVNVEGMPADGNHNRADMIEGLGEGISGPFDTSSADTQVTTTNNHNQFGAMFQAAGGSELFDSEY